MSCSDFERAIGLEDFVERFRADAVERFHRAQNLRARHQHPFGRFLQQLRGELAADRVKQIVGRENDRVLLHLDRQNVMLENEPAGQDRETCRDRSVFASIETTGTLKKLPIALGTLFVHLAGIEDLSGPRTAVEIRGELRPLRRARHAAGEEQIDEGLTDSGFIGRSLLRMSEMHSRDPDRS